MRSLVSRFGLASSGGVTAFVVGPGCLTCTLPAIWGALSVVGLASAAFWMHNLTLPVAPIVAFVVWRNRRHHGQLRPGRWAMAGAGLVVVHFALHPVAQQGRAVVDALWVLADWVGVVALGAAVVLDLAILRQQACLVEPAAVPAAEA